MDVFVTPCFVAVTKCVTKGMTVAHSSRVQSIVVVKAWCPEHETAGYITSSVREAQTITARAQFYLFI